MPDFFRKRIPFLPQISSIVPHSLHRFLIAAAETVEMLTVNKNLPSIPQNLTITTNNFGVYLTWTRSLDAARYVIYQNSSNSFTTARAIAAVDDPTTRFLDTQRDSARRYYWVRGENSLGDNGPVSLMVSVIPSARQDVHDFGATGDNVVNDATNIQLAINETTGAAVYLRPGTTYLTTATIQLASNTRLYSDGPGATIRYTGTDFAIRCFATAQTSDNESRNVVDGIALDISSANPIGGIDLNGTTTNKCNHNQITNIRITGNGAGAAPYGIQAGVRVRTEGDGQAWHNYISNVSVTKIRHAVLFNQAGGASAAPNTNTIYHLVGKKVGTLVNFDAGNSNVIFHAEGDEVGAGAAITGASNATPIEITSIGHPLGTGDQIYIVGVTGNTAANGYYTITNTGADIFTLDGSVGNGVYIAGGTWSVAGIRFNTLYCKVYGYMPDIINPSGTAWIATTSGQRIAGATAVGSHNWISGFFGVQASGADGGRGNCALEVAGVADAEGGGMTLKSPLLIATGDPTTTSVIGTPIRRVISASAALDFPNTLAQTSSDLTIAMTGAALGDAVMLGVPNAAVGANSAFTAWVSAADVVTVRFNNYSALAINPALATFRVAVMQF